MVEASIEVSFVQKRREWGAIDLSFSAGIVFIPEAMMILEHCGGITGHASAEDILRERMRRAHALLRGVASVKA
jgi:hypothetical protein